MAAHGASGGGWWAVLGLAALLSARTSRRRVRALGAAACLLSAALSSGACSGAAEVGREDEVEVSFDAATSATGGAGARPAGDPPMGGRGGGAAPPAGGRGGEDETDKDDMDEGGGGTNVNAGGMGGGRAAGAADMRAGGASVPPGPGGGGGAPASSPDAGAGGAAPTTAAGCSVTMAGGTGNEPGGQIPVCCTPAASDKAMIDEVFALLNAHRMANGRSALAYDAKLELAIQGHCQHMAQHAFFAHAAPEQKVASFTSRASACGAAAAGENIAFNQRNAAQVMTSWKNSAGHNMNMLNTGYKRVGIGEYQLRWGQIFGR